MATGDDDDAEAADERPRLAGYVACTVAGAFVDETIGVQHLDHLGPLRGRERVWWSPPRPAWPVQERLPPPVRRAPAYAQRTMVATSVSMGSRIRKPRSLAILVETDRHFARPMSTLLRCAGPGPYCRGVSAILRQPSLDGAV